MKKIFITIATIGLLSTGVYAADGGKKADKPAMVTYSLRNDFESAFSDATNVSWSVTSNCQKATFTQNNVRKTAFYNLQGEYLGLTQDVDYNTIDSKAQKTIATQY